MTQPRHINYKDDFVLRERFRDDAGNLTPLPDGVDFELRYWVKHGRQFIASRQGQDYTNCVPDGDALLVIFKDHNLCEGTLKRELHLRLTNDIMPDGVQNLFIPKDPGIELWQFPADSSGVLESDLVATYNRGPAFTYDDFTPEQLAALKGDKGDPFTWDDFTPAQIEILKKPAIDAADKANKAAERAETAAGEVNKQIMDLTAASSEAVKACTAATDAAGKSAKAADTATDYARAAAAATNAQCEITEQTRRRLETVAERAEQVAAPVPDGLRVQTPAPITLRNPVPCYISARVLPAGALQNMIFQAFGGSAGSACGPSALIEPDGRILPLAPGLTRVHVIPTAGTRFFKTVEVHVIAPALRLASPSALRLDKAGNIRLT